jgi:hypothetical protein
MVEAAKAAAPWPCSFRHDGERMLNFSSAAAASSCASSAAVATWVLGGLQRHLRRVGVG